MAVPAPILEHDEIPQEDHFVHLYGATWAETYQPVDQSQVLPGIDLAQLASFLDRPTTSQAIREYRDALNAK